MVPSPQGLDGRSGDSRQLQALGPCCESQQSAALLFQIANPSFARCCLGVCKRKGKYRVWKRGKGGKNIDGETGFLGSRIHVSHGSGCCRTTFPM